jgi:hypothetical protein
MTSEVCPIDSSAVRELLTFVLNAPQLAVYPGPKPGHFLHVAVRFGYDRSGVTRTGG